MPETPPRQATRARLERAARDAARQRRALLHAMAGFGDEFDLAAWRQAFTAEEPEQDARVATVLFPFSTLVNDLNELLALGAELAGSKRRRELVPMPDLYGRLVDAGALARAHAAELERINRVRNRVTHAYARASADETHAAILALLEALPRVLARHNRWLGERGVEL